MFETTCPSCQHLFSVAPNMLYLARGWVKCSQCQHGFNANKRLRRAQNTSASAPAAGNEPAAAVPPGHTGAAMPPPVRSKPIYLAAPAIESGAVGVLLPAIDKTIGIDLITGEIPLHLPRHDAELQAGAGTDEHDAGRVAPPEPADVIRANDPAIMAASSADDPPLSRKDAAPWSEAMNSAETERSPSPAAAAIDRAQEMQEALAMPAATPQENDATAPSTGNVDAHAQSQEHEQDPGRWLESAVKDRASHPSPSSPWDAIIHGTTPAEMATQAGRETATEPTVEGIPVSSVASGTGTSATTVAATAAETPTDPRSNAPDAAAAPEPATEPGADWALMIGAKDPLAPASAELTAASAVVTPLPLPEQTDPGNTGSEEASPFDDFTRSLQNFATASKVTVLAGVLPPSTDADADADADAIAMSHQQEDEATDAAFVPLADAAGTAPENMPALIANDDVVTKAVPTGAVPGKAVESSALADAGPAPFGTRDTMPEPLGNFSQKPSATTAPITGELAPASDAAPQPWAAAAQAIASTGPAASATAPVQAAATPEFMRKAEDTPPTPRVWRVAAMLLTLLVLVEMVILGRHVLAAHIPASAAPLRSICSIVGCEVRALRQIHMMSIEHADLIGEQDAGDRYKLDLLLRNRAAKAAAMPSIELTLSSLDDQVIARKTWAPAEYLPDARRPVVVNGVPALGELSLQLEFETHLPATRYRVLIYYP